MIKAPKHHYMISNRHGQSYDTSAYLASDGCFYYCYLYMRGCRTLVYKKRAYAMKRLEKIAKAYPDACIVYVPVE